MIQTVVDNYFDAGISTQDGRLSTQILVVLLTPTSKIETANKTSSETINHLSHIQWLNSLIMQMRGLKKVQTPTMEAKVCFSEDSYKFDYLIESSTRNIHFIS